MWLTVFFSCISVFLRVNGDPTWPSESDYYYRPLLKPTDPCLYHKCNTDPLTSCIFSSDLLTPDECKQREACQRLVVWETRRTGPSSEELVLSLYSFEIEDDKPFELELDAIYERNHQAQGKQTFKCQYFNNSVSAIMIEFFNNSQVLGGKGNHAAHYINCEWIISPSGPFWPLDYSGRKVNLFDHVFIKNDLIVNKRTVFVSTIRPNIEMLSYLTDVLYPNSSYPFNPCQKYHGIDCEGRLLIGRAKDALKEGRYFQAYLIVFDEAESIRLIIRYLNSDFKGMLYNFAELFCKRNESIIAKTNETSESSSQSQSFALYDCHDIAYPIGNDEDEFLYSSHLNVSSVVGNEGLRLSWFVMVPNFSTFFVSPQSGKDLIFEFQVEITLKQGTFITKGTSKIPVNIEKERDHDLVLLQPKVLNCPINGQNFVVKSSCSTIQISLLIVFLINSFLMT